MRVDVLGSTRNVSPSVSGRTRCSPAPTVLQRLRWVATLAAGLPVDRRSYSEAIVPRSSSDAALSHLECEVRELKNSELKRASVPRSRALSSVLRYQPSKSSQPTKPAAKRSTTPIGHDEPKMTRLRYSPRQELGMKMLSSSDGSSKR
eukprot:6931712-Prymnesium_polylepis.2